MSFATIDYDDPAFWQNPHPVLREARRLAPLARSGATGAWIVLRYDDVDRLLPDRRLGAVGTGSLEAKGIRSGRLHDFVRRIVLTNDPPVHTRLRGLVARAFTPRHVERVRPLTREIAKRLLDEAHGRERIDVVSDFADVLPVQVISALLGVPGEDWKLFSRWTTDLSAGFSPVIPEESRPRIESALENLHGYVGDLVEERRRRPGDDLLDALIAAEEAGDRLSPEELRVMVIGLLFGGHDTTRSLLSTAVWLLWSHPEERAALRRDPALVPSAVEEILRYEPPILSVARRVLEPLEIGGVTLREDSLLALCVLSANRDDSRYSDPDRFLVRRGDRSHLAFGGGRHFCLGAALARAETEETLRILVERLDDATVKVEVPRWVPYQSIRRLESLPLAPGGRLLAGSSVEPARDA